MNILRIIPLFILLAVCGPTPDDGGGSSTGSDAGPGSSGGPRATTSDPTTSSMLPTTTTEVDTTAGSGSTGALDTTDGTTGSTGALNTTGSSGNAPTGDTSSDGDASSTDIDTPEQICFGDACEVDADCGPNFVCLEHPHAHTLMCVAGCFGLGGCGNILAELNCGAFAPQEPLAECLKLDDGRACFPRPCETLDDCPAKAIACVGGLCL